MRFLSKPLWLTAGLISLSLFAVTQHANAGIQVSGIRYQEIADPTFLYEIEVFTDDCTIRVGDFVTIYDMFGAGDNLDGIGGVHFIPNPGWVRSTPAIGQTPIGQTPVDDPNLFNISWTFTGALPDIPPMTTFFLYVVIEQPLAKAPNAYWSATCNGGRRGSSGVVATQGVPEPSTLCLLGMGSLGLALIRARRKHIDS